MKTVEVYVASAFSKNGSGGNLAGVVINEQPLNEKEKTELAGLLGYSETVFLSRSEKADFLLEYFTPTGEIPLCGHATIGTFVILKELEWLNQPNYTIETKSGILDIIIDEDSLIFMEQNLPAFGQIFPANALENCFDTKLIQKDFSTQIVSTGLKDLLVPIEQSNDLGQLLPNKSAISDLSQKIDVVGIHAFSIVNNPPVTAICRNFAPLYGIDEESATGTSNCALACYLFQNGIKQKDYIFEQGHQLNSVSQIHVHLEIEKDQIQKVFVGGHGYLVCKKEVQLHD